MNYWKLYSYVVKKIWIAIPLIIAMNVSIILNTLSFMIRDYSIKYIALVICVLFTPVCSFFYYKTISNFLLISEGKEHSDILLIWSKSKLKKFYGNFTIVIICEWIIFFILNLFSKMFGKNFVNALGDFQFYFNCLTTFISYIFLFSVSLPSYAANMLSTKFDRERKLDSIINNLKNDSANEARKKSTILRGSKIISIEEAEKLNNKNNK